MLSIVKPLQILIYNPLLLKLNNLLYFCTLCNEPVGSTNISFILCEKCCITSFNMNFNFSSSFSNILSRIPYLNLTSFNLLVFSYFLDYQSACLIIYSSLLIYYNYIYILTFLTSECVIHVSQKCNSLHYTNKYLDLLI